MALSGAISSNFGYDNSFTLSVEWTATQNIANNTSTVTARLYVKSNQYRAEIPSSTKICGISLAGGGKEDNFNTLLVENQKKQILSYTRTISHNASTGAASFLLRAAADFGGMSVRYPNNPQQTYTLPGSVYLGPRTFTLNTIPRASTLDSFSIANHLKPNTSNTVNLSITRRSTSLTHDIQLRDGSTVLQTWTGQGTPSTLTISSSTVNTLLSRMSHVTSRSLTLRVQTKSGSSNIGSAVSRSATATVHADVKPTATSLSVSISGSGRDKTIGKYVQNISKVYASFTGSATGGASVSSRKIVVRRKSDSGDSQTISSGSGTTANPVALIGTYTAIATVTDSRGRSASTSTDFTVHFYRPPRISSFQASRLSDTPTIVNIIMKGSWDALGGDNALNIHVQKRLASDGSWSTVETTTGVTGTMNNTINSANNDITKSYIYRLTITDQFGKAVTATTSVPTERTVLDIHKDEGVGIGKLHERGSLDIAGAVWINGGRFDRPMLIPKGTDLNDIKTPGLYASGGSANGTTLINRPTAASPAFTLEVFPSYTTDDTDASVVQRLTPLTGTPVCIRTYYQNSDTWHPWYKFEMDYA